MKREAARGGIPARNGRDALPRVRNMKRRTFIKTGAAAVAGAAALPGATMAAEPAATVVVVHGTDIAKMVEAGIAKMGGWDKFFKPGKLAGLEELVPAAHLRDAGLDHLRDVGAVDDDDGRGRLGRHGSPGQGRRAGDRRRAGLDERAPFHVADARERVPPVTGGNAAPCCFSLHGVLPFGWLTRTLYHNVRLRNAPYCGILAAVPRVRPDRDRNRSP